MLPILSCWFLSTGLFFYCISQFLRFSESDCFQIFKSAEAICTCYLNSVSISEIKCNHLTPTRTISNPMQSVSPCIYLSHCLFTCSPLNIGCLTILGPMMQPNDVAQTENPILLSPAHIWMQPSWPFSPCAFLHFKLTCNFGYFIWRLYDAIWNSCDRWMLMIVFIIGLTFHLLLNSRLFLGFSLFCFLCILSKNFWFLSCNLWF